MFPNPAIGRMCHKTWRFAAKQMHAGMSTVGTAGGAPASSCDIFGCLGGLHAAL